MIVRARAPLRLGLAGGGTDVSPYAELHGGLVMNVTIARYAYATLERADGEVAFRSVDRGHEETHPVAAPVPVDGPLALLKATYNRICRDFRGGEAFGCRLTTLAEAPAGSGLGSSSTMVVAIVQAFVEMLGLPLGEYDVAHLAFEIERLDLGLGGGRQDQYAAAFGGFNFMEFHGGDRVIVNPLRIKDFVARELEARMVLYFTGVSRDSAAIIDRQAASVRAGEAERIEAMHRIKASATAMKEALLRGDFARVAETLNAGWASKRAMASAISTDVIERAQDVARDAGAIAGKVSGAGGGGFMMFLAPLERRSALEAALTRLGGRVETVGFTQAGAAAWRVG